MAIPRVNQPPTAGGTYIIPQLEGEILCIPGSKSVFRILASSLQSDGLMSVFTSGGAIADAPGFHHHNEAHDIFMVTKGFLQLWIGDQCKILGPGDFASVPPGIIHNPKTLGPHTEIFGLITPGDWVDFFRYVSEPYNGILYPEFDDRNLREMIISKMKNASREYDVVFHPKHQGCEVSEWSPSDEKLPTSTTPYYLRANTGPRWLLGGVMSRPFITTAQSDGKFAISSMESSSRHEPSVFSQRLTFPKVHHCLSVLEGVLKVSLGDGASDTIREGETVFIPADTTFSLEFTSKFCRLWSFSSGDGIESLIHEGGTQFKGFVIPDEVVAADQSRFEAACERFNVVLDRGQSGRGLNGLKH